jgi:hypothetical protein
VAGEVGFVSGVCFVVSFLLGVFLVGFAEDFFCVPEGVVCEKAGRTTPIATRAIITK